MDNGTFKQIILSLSLVLCGFLSAFAQERPTSVADVLASLPSDGCVCADYNLTVSAPKNTKISYVGKLWWQNGGLFRVEGDGYSIFCNGEHIWTVDSTAGEIVREEAVSVDELIPSAGSGESEMNVSWSPDGKRLTKIYLTMKNGTAVSIAVPSMTFVESKSSDFFTYNEKSIPSGFVFTPLD